MRRLKLDLKDLKVESFETNSSDRKKGTVLGQSGAGCTLPACTEFDPTCDSTCLFQPTCDETCPNTCGNTCPTCHWSCVGTCDDITCFGGRQCL